MVVFFLSVKCELKGTFCIASWRGIKVAVKRLKEEVTANGDKVRAFRDELALLQKIRHPNVGDLRAFLKRKGALKPTTAVRFALDIASRAIRLYTLSQFEFLIDEAIINDKNMNFMRIGRRYVDVVEAFSDHLRRSLPLRNLCVI
ncbi:hypothetical protein HYC85_018032 [Camellia sinensis]|uniref:Protein kinase domain-containing protein n=1 Tax=Camellia sinensis TaxID=4442 RepID=A0A7J7GUR7_CAMSI|nr:hypothetical protein HYC85_018032 [Camellia sinensis]